MNVAARAVVALDQHADRVAAGLGGEHARRGADAALEAVADHPGAAADVALGDGPAARAVERREHVLGLHVEAVDVVEQAVVGLGHDRQAPGLQARPRHLPLEDRVAHDADAVRVGDRDRALEEAALLEPRRPGHLAVAVEREPGAEHGIAARLAARVDDGDAGAHRALARRRARPSPETSVVWPTSTPATSVIASSGPAVPPMSGTRPSSRARGFGAPSTACGAAATTASITASESFKASS